MENGQLSSAKKARVESPGGRQVKQEVREEKGDATGGGALVAVDGAAARAEIAVRIDKAVLHCPLCNPPLKPPIFQCAFGHLACGSCHEAHDQLPTNQCKSCDDGGAYGRCFAMDTFISSAVVPCPHEAYGCRSNIAYYQVGDHQSACPQAPCACSEPGCAFVRSPPTLLDHLAATPHSWPVDKVRYGEALRLRVPESERRRLLVAEEDDGRVFVPAVGGRGACASPLHTVPVTVAAAAVHLQDVGGWARGPGGGQGGQRGGGGRGGAEQRGTRRDRHGGGRGGDVPGGATQDVARRRRVQADAPQHPHRQGFSRLTPMVNQAPLQVGNGMKRGQLALTLKPFVYPWIAHALAQCVLIGSLRHSTHGDRRAFVTRTG